MLTLLRRFETGVKLLVCNSYANDLICGYDVTSDRKKVLVLELLIIF
jgi:hypothetical protein